MSKTSLSFYFSKGFFYLLCCFQQDILFPIKSNLNSNPFSYNAPKSSLDIRKIPPPKYVLLGIIRHHYNSFSDPCVVETNKRKPAIVVYLIITEHCRIAVDKHVFQGEKRKEKKKTERKQAIKSCSQL